MFHASGPVTFVGYETGDHERAYHIFIFHSVTE